MTFPPLSPPPPAKWRGLPAFALGGLLALGLPQGCKVPNPDYGEAEPAGSGGSRADSGAGGEVREGGVDVVVPRSGGQTGAGGDGGQGSQGGPGGTGQGGTGGGGATGGAGGGPSDAGGQGGTAAVDASATGGSGGQPAAGGGGSSGTGDAAPMNPDLRADGAKATGADLTTGLVGHWDMNAAAGATTTADESGHGHTATLEGADPQKAWVAGKLGNALDLDGTAGDYLEVPANPDLDKIQSFTIAAWVKRTQDAVNRPMSVVSRQSAASAETYNLTYNHGGLVLYLPYAAGASYSANSSKRIPLNQWVHIAATYDGKTGRLYEDGVQSGVVDYAVKLPATANPLLIGNNVNVTGADQAFIGSIDEVLIYAVVLPPAAIAELASSTKPLP